MPSTSASPGEKRGGKDFAAPGPADRWFPALWERELAREGKEPGAAVSALWRIKWAAKGCAEVAFLLRPDDKKGSGGRSFGGRGGDANTSLSSRGGRGGCQDHRQPRPSPEPRGRGGDSRPGEQADGRQLGLQGHQAQVAGPGH
nr:BET1-like protein isoform X2 [Vulpes vulpes]